MRGLTSAFLVLGFLLGGACSATSILGQSSSAADLLPDSLPLGHAACFRVDREGSFDLPSLVERLAEMPNAAAQLEDLGWEDGAYRQFACDAAPAGHVNWVEADIHRFKDASSAATAVLYFASARALATRLHSVAAGNLGNTSAALTGPSDTGTEYTLYVSSGPLLLRVTGLAPSGDPAADVTDVVTAWLSDIAADRTRQIPATPTEPPASRRTGPTTYTIQDLGVGTRATDVNNRGQVLIASRTAEGQHVGIWQAGEVSDLSSLGIESVSAINDAGTVLARQRDRSVLYDSNAGTMTPIPGFDATAYATDFNDAGTVIGQEALETNSPGVIGPPVMSIGGTIRQVPLPPGCAFLQSRAINEAGEIVGKVSGCQGLGFSARAALVTDGVVTILDAAPGATASRANDVNDIGQVVGDPGGCADCGNPYDGRAFLYDGQTGTMHDLGTLPNHKNSLAFAVNNAGQVVGYAWPPVNDADPLNRAYLYDHRTGVITDLNQLIPHDSEWRLDVAYDINDAGQIVGQGLINGEMHAFLLTPAL